MKNYKVELKNYHIELTNLEGDHLKNYLRKNNINYETSGISNNFIHFEILATEEQANKINNHMDQLYKF